MKRITAFVFAIIATLVFSMTAFAAEEKVGFVDDMAVLQQSAKFKQAQQQLDTITSVAKAKGVTIVLNKALVFYGGIDLTQDVITALKR